MHEPLHEKTNNFGFRPGPTQTGLYKHRRLEVGNFGFRKKRNCTIRVAKTKAMISFAVTYAKCWFSHAKAHISVSLLLVKNGCFIGVKRRVARAVWATGKQN